MMNRQHLRYFFQEIILQKTIREGLLLALPFLIVGSIALTIHSVPLPAYQSFITTAFNGQIHYMLSLIHDYTLSIIPLLLILTMSFSYGRAVSNDFTEILFYPIVTFCSYLVFLKTPNTLLFSDIFSATQTLTSILVTILSCSIFHLFHSCKFTNLQYYLTIPSTTFSIIYRMILPAFIVLLFFSFANVLVGSDIKDICMEIHLKLFNNLDPSLFSTSLFIVLEQFYWFVGIHGSNALNFVGVTLFKLPVNMPVGLNELTDAKLFTKNFLDVFISIGGCGSVLALVVSIFLFGKTAHTRRIAKISILPCLFNISEVIIIGLPIICNPIFFVPFLVVPLLFLFCCTFAIQLGIVPAAVYPVSWTTPVFLSGYLATGSIAGSFLQLFILILGAFAYKPFIQLYEQAETENFKTKFNSLVAEVIYCESVGKSPIFLTNNKFSELAKVLSSDLRQAIQNKDLALYYQPQVHYDGTIYGAEALLRWNHPQVGYIYPPLIIFLANERGFLDELGIYLIEKACHDLEYITKELGQPLKLSINISPSQLYNELFCGKVRDILKKYQFGKSIMAFELTEQIALSSTIDTMDRLQELKSMGIMLSMDDFGMGHSSVMYLQDSEFDVVKLDGSLVKKVLTSDRSVDIITAITQLSEKFNFKVVAEYVETVEQRERLASLGCYIYQGWLYCRAIPLGEFLTFVKDHEKGRLKQKA